MKKLFVILVLSLFLPVLVQSQPLGIAFPDTTVFPGTIQIPVSLSGTALVGSFDLEFKYYNVIGSFLQITDVNPNLTGLFEVEHMIGGATDWVRVHWESPEFVQLSGNTLFTVEMDYWGGSTPLEWLDWTDSTCAFYGPTGVVPLTSYIPGSINQASGIPDQDESGYTLYPNPFSGGSLVLTRVHSNAGEVIRITDPMGRIVFEEEWNPGNTDYRIDYDQLKLNAGIYCVKILKADENYSVKLVVQ